MKYVGMMLVIVAGIGLGLYHAWRLRRRVTLLCQLERLLTTLAQRMEHSAKPLPVLWQEMANTETLEKFPLLKATADGLKTHRFHEAFSNAVSQSDPALQTEERELLLEFAQGCGQLGLKEQLDHIAAYRQQLNQLRMTAQQQANIKGQVYQMMGVAGGVGLALLFL